MKRIVLSEGKRDVVFVEQFLERQSGDNRVTRFVGEDVQHSRLKNRESECIRNFLEPRNPYDCLVKSENGKADLKRVFAKLVRFLVSSDAEVCLLIDLDSRPLDALFDDLDDRVAECYSGKEYEIVHSETVAQSDVQIGATAELRSDGDVRGEFDVLAFRSSLEDAAGIDDTDDQEGKLGELLEESDVIAPTYQLFTDASR